MTKTKPRVIGMAVPRRGSQQTEVIMQQTKVSKLIPLLKRGWVSPIDALNQCGLMSLSQRIGELRRDGLNIVDKWVSHEGGRHKAYRIVR